jgi:hypothetical protein
MLAKEIKTQNDGAHKKYQETGVEKRKGNNNSNKIMDFRAFIG